MIFLQIINLINKSQYTPITSENVQRIDEIEINELLNIIQKQKETVDANLTHPAYWRGSLRHKTRNPPTPEKSRRVSMTFNWLIKQIDVKSINSNFVQLIHDSTIGGLSFRQRRVHIEHFWDFPSAVQVPSLLNKTLIGILSDEFAPLIAAKAHLKLLDIHPFSDGNGRTARLLSSFILMQKGYCSTLLTATEQYFHSKPKFYAQILAKYRNGKIHEKTVIKIFLLAMIKNSFAVTWFRLREKRLRKHCQNIGIKEKCQDDELIGFDLGSKTVEKALFKILSEMETPLYEIFKKISSQEKVDLLNQIQRLRKEENADKSMNMFSNKYEEAILNISLRN